MGDTDRHKTHRRYESGAQKRKLAAERERKRDQCITKTSKLSHYFKSLKQPDNGVPTTSKETAPLSENECGDLNAKDRVVEGEGGDSSESVVVTDRSIATNSKTFGIENENSKEDETSKLTSGFDNDVGLWPKYATQDMVDFWAVKGSCDLQNCSEQLFHERSLHQDQTKGDHCFVRKCSKNFFMRKNRNNETINRFWLCFSPTTGKVYCYVCKLVALQKVLLAADGFCDWKHAYQRLAEHETSKSHLESVTILAKRGRDRGRIDHELLKQEEEVRGYWRKVLMRVVSTIKFIAERGLAFRGDNELVGSPRNGNFLGIMELIAQYDPFLATHIKEHANKGSGHTNYLSSSVYEEIVNLMGESVQNEIIGRIKKSKYYSLTVDSTPDEAHIDQLTVVIRYMEGSSPKERFLTFLPNCGHTGFSIANALLDFLGKSNIDIQDCRGQSYDNAPNMCGKYNGMQSFITEKNHLAVLVPCCGHSLNLVGKAAANACPAAVNFFDFVQHVYVFFTACIGRYKILTEKLSQSEGNVLVPKSLSETRWSCRADAVKAIVNGYGNIKEGLEEIANNEEQKDIVKNEAGGLLRKMCSLEITIYAIFWNDLLERFNATNKIVQDPKLVLHSAVAAIKSLKSFVESKRDLFEEYEEKAQEISQTKEYAQERTRQRMKNVRLNPLEYGKAPETQLSQRERFRIESFISVIDKLSSSLSDRLSAYDTVIKRFGFLSQLDVLNPSEILSTATNLVTEYRNDLEPSLGNELVQFAALVVDMKENYKDCLSKEMFLYEILNEHNFRATFPNVEILLRMYLVLMVSNSSGERSFSKMKLIKNRLRTTMNQDRLTYLSLLSMENDILHEMDFKDIIDMFAAKKARKVCI